MPTIINIDAKGKTLGRVGSETAKALLGKTTTAYRRHLVSDVSVHVTNVSHLKIDPRKLTGIIYTRYTGHPGGLRKETLAHRTKTKGIETAFRMLVRGMLPKNKLRDLIMKRLTVTK